MNNDMCRRDALIRKIECCKVHTDQECETDRQWAIGFNAGIDRALFTIIHAHVVNIEPVRHGRWIMRGGKFRCSECDAAALQKDEGGTGGFSHEYVYVKSNYCPNCGAKMDAEVKE